MLSEEEHNAIEWLNKYIKNIKHEWQECDDSKAVRTVLNIITKLQKEIEYQKEKRENQKSELAILNEKQKEMNKLINTVKTYQGQFKRQEKVIKQLKEENEILNIAINKQTIDISNNLLELQEKDKQIDLMAEFIFQNIDIEENLCNSAYVECKQEMAQDITCINCVKQYFERKVKMEIEVEEYVRTKNGKIDKIINNNCYMPQYIECEKSLLYKEDIVNHSKDIIDLIEVGDIVEIELSEEFVEKEDKKVLTQIGEVYTKETLQKDIDNGIITKILTILTKEQYMQNCYKLVDRPADS